MKLNFGNVLAFLFGTFLAVGIVLADTPMKTTKTYNINRVIDGDTVEIGVPGLPKELKGTLLLRLYGIDTPEKGHKAKCAQESILALKAKYFVQKELKDAKEVSVHLIKWDKYGGRVIGQILVDGIPLTQKLLDKNLARVYNGGKKEGWC